MQVFHEDCWAQQKRGKYLCVSKYIIKVYLCAVGGIDFDIIYLSALEQNFIHAAAFVIWWYGQYLCMS